MTNAVTIKLKTGSGAPPSLALGEPAWDTTGKILYIGTAAGMETAGGSGAYLTAGASMQTKEVGATYGGIRVNCSNGGGIASFEVTEAGQAFGGGLRYEADVNETGLFGRENNVDTYVMRWNRTGSTIGFYTGGTLRATWGTGELKMATHLVVENAMSGATTGWRFRTDGTAETTAPYFYWDIKDSISEDYDIRLFSTPGTGNLGLTGNLVLNSGKSVTAPGGLFISATFGLALSGSDTTVSFDTNDYINYNRTNNRWTFHVGLTEVGRVSIDDKIVNDVRLGAEYDTNPAGANAWHDFGDTGYLIAGLYLDADRAVYAVRFRTIQKKLLGNWYTVDVV